MQTSDTIRQSGSENLIVLTGSLVCVISAHGRQHLRPSVVVVVVVLPRGFFATSIKVCGRYAKSARELCNSIENSSR